MRTIDNINDLNKSDFLSVFGNVFEKTESVALETFKSKPFKNFDDIMFKMLNIYEGYELFSTKFKKDTKKLILFSAFRFLRGSE